MVPCGESGRWEEPEPGPLYRTIVGRSPVGSRSGDRVLVNVNIPSAKMKPADFLGLPGMSGLGGMCDLSPTYTVEINPADIPARGFAAPREYPQRARHCGKRVRCTRLPHRISL